MPDTPRLPGPPSASGNEQLIAHRRLVRWWASAGTRAGPLPPDLQALAPYREYPVQWHGIWAAKRLAQAP